jgi:hypothetical protein
MSVALPAENHATAEAKFRRDAAHALSTPLGALLLQAELVEHFLHQDDLGSARRTVASLMSDCESFARLLRSVFAAMADMAEDGTDRSDPQACLSEALEELGDEVIAIEYEGESPPVSLPPAALTALMRRLAEEATALGAPTAVLSASRDEAMLRLSLGAPGGEKPATLQGPFEGKGSLNLWTAREIVDRHHGRIVFDDASPHLFSVLLPIDPRGP